MKKLFPVVFSVVLAAVLFLGCAAPQQQTFQRAPFSEECATLMDSLAGWGPKADAAHVEALNAAAKGDFTTLSKWREGLIRPADEVAFNTAHAGKVTLSMEGPWVVYTPAVTPVATVVYLHGGGWIVGDARLCEEFCAGLAEKAGVQVWSLNYPLAPEHPFPETPHYIAERIQALRERFSNRPLYVAGDSAGGNLAAVSALLLPGKIDGLILAYPALSIHDKVAPESETYGDALMSAFGRLYVDEETSATNPIASPLIADDVALRAFPPVLTLAAECDVLAGQSRVFHERLAGLGRDCDVRHVVRGSVHGFLSFPTLKGAQSEAVDVAAGWILGRR